MDQLLRTLNNLRDELGREGAHMPAALDGLEPDDGVGLLLACAYPDRIAQNREKGGGGAASFLLSGGKGVTFPQRAEDPLASQVD